MHTIKAIVRSQRRTVCFKSPPTQTCSGMVSSYPPADHVSLTLTGSDDILFIERCKPRWCEEVFHRIRHLKVTYERGQAMGEGRHTVGVVFSILKGIQLRIHRSDSECFFSKKQRSVARITTAQMAQIERKWHLITKT